MAIIEDIPENYENLRAILEILKLEVKCFLAFYLKLANIIFGISSHSGTHACLWCDSELQAEAGCPRTLRSLDSNYEAFKENSSKRKDMKLFKNVINKRLVYLDHEDEELHHIVTPPELHMIMCPVNLIGYVLSSLWPEYQTFLKSNSIIRHGYQGGGWDGANSNKILKLLDKMELLIPPHLLPFVYCLRKFKQVVDSCFGNNLDNDFEDRICAFKSAFLECKDVSQSFGQDLRLTWKVHIIFNHIVPFCKYHNSGLGMFAEQTGESIHAKFKSTYARYKRDSQHIDHGSN